MKIPFAISSAMVLLLSTGVVSAQATISPPRPQAQPWLPAQSGFTLVGSTMNNYFPALGTSIIAANANTPMRPLLPPSLPTFRSQPNAFRPQPLPGAQTTPPPPAGTPWQLRPR